MGHYSGTSLWWSVWVWRKMLIISNSLPSWPPDPYKQLTLSPFALPICMSLAPQTQYSELSLLFLLLQNLCTFASETSCFPLPSDRCEYTFSLLKLKLCVLLGPTLSLSFAVQSVTSENLPPLVPLLWVCGLALASPVLSGPCGGRERPTREDLFISVAAMPQRQNS